MNFFSRLYRFDADRFPPTFISRALHTDSFRVLSDWEGGFAAPFLTGLMLFCKRIANLIGRLGECCYLLLLQGAVEPLRLTGGCCHLRSSSLVLCNPSLQIAVEWLRKGCSDERWVFRFVFGDLFPRSICLVKSGPPVLEQPYCKLLRCFALRCRSYWNPTLQKHRCEKMRSGHRKRRQAEIEWDESRREEEIRKSGLG